jgi:hypothetical protein
VAAAVLAVAVLAVAVLAVGVLVTLAGCWGVELPTVDLQVECPGVGSSPERPVPGLESRPAEIVLRERFLVTGGGCPELSAEVIRVPAGGFLLRVQADFPGDPGPPGDQGPTYTARLRGVPSGSQRLRVVHVLTGAGGSEDRPIRVREVMDHPVLVPSTP